MSTARAGTPGATRVCPHCKAVVLETAAVCPGCRHHLRFNASDAQFAGAEAYCAFNIEGTIAHKQAGEHCEYCIVLDIRNERGEQIMRQVVGVGALHPGELRRLNLAVEMLPVRATVPKSEPAAATRDPRRSPAPPVAARPAAPVPVPTPAPAPTAVSPSRTPAAAPAPLTSTPKPVAATPVAAANAALPKAAAAPAANAAPAKEPSGQARLALSEPAAEQPSSLSQRLRLFRKP